MAVRPELTPYLPGPSGPIQDEIGQIALDLIG